MKTTTSIGTLLLVASAALAGCASERPRQTSTPYSTPYQTNAASYGSIESIQVTRSAGASSGAGAVVGGLVGGLLGNQIGNGDGRTAATVVGAVGGAMVGNSVEKNRTAQGSDMYQIRVHLDNGSTATVMQDSIYELRIGDRVRVVDGRVYRY